MVLHVENFYVVERSVGTVTNSKNGRNRDFSRRCVGLRENFKKQYFVFNS